MIIWEKSSDYSIKSSDGKYSIARFVVDGEDLFRVFEHKNKYEAVGLFLCDKAQEAKDYVVKLVAESEAAHD